MTINIHIDSVILDGIDFSPQQQAEFRAALNRELTHMFSTDKAVQWGTRQSLAMVQADPIEVEAKPGPSQLGRQVAQTVYTSVRPTHR